MTQVHNVFDRAQSDTYSMAEAAVKVGISRRQMYRLAAHGEIAPGVPVLRLGRSQRIPKVKLDAFVAGDLVVAS